MTKQTSSMSLSLLISKSSIMADNINLNAATISKYGLDLPSFTTEMQNDINKLTNIDKEQERLKSELKAKTEELNTLQAKLKSDYAKAKKVVKLAEPQVNWTAYGIEDKR